jgi:hypothetical protein
LARFSTIPMSEARIATLPPRRALQEQYCEYVRQLTPETAGTIELGEGDRSITERARLKAAAKAEGLTLHIQRKGNTIVFWLEEQAPAPRAEGPRRGRPPGQGRR